MSYLPTAPETDRYGNRGLRVLLGIYWGLKTLKRLFNHYRAMLFALDTTSTAADIALFYLQTLALI